MKKVLLLTDGSVDMALSLNNWLQAQSELIDLTVVYAFTQNANQPLNAALYRQGRQAATEALNRWLSFLSEFPSGPSSRGELHTEMLLGEPELVLTIHLLLRQYDYLLIDSGQTGLVSAFRSCQRQISTQLCFLSVPEETVYTPGQTQQSAYDFPFIPANSQLAA